jgi:membrane-associated PAP2 superfamily phosphatase
MRLPLRRSWWREVRWPIAFFIPTALLFAFSDIDSRIANALFFHAVDHRWIGAHQWWVESFLHTGGRWAIRAVVAVALAIVVAATIDPALRTMRRPAAYFVISSVLGIGLVGLLKSVTNVDCPWDLEPFGGRFPLVGLFADRADALRRGHCFPAAHASTGYALVALYFVCRERSRVLARVGLAIGIAVGIAFGLAQQSRGAHFMSHDLWSACIVWLVAASVYVLGFSARLHMSQRAEVTGGALGLVCDHHDALRGRDCGRREAEAR